jgi:hypothetical protein
MWVGIVTGEDPGIGNDKVGCLAHVFLRRQNYILDFECLDKIRRHNLDVYLKGPLIIRQYNQWQ